MSASAKQSANTVVSATLNGAEISRGFTTPLNDLIKCGVGKVVVRYSKDGKSYINGINDSRNCICKVEYNKAFTDSFSISKDHALGIYELSEFVGLTSIVGSNGCNITVSEVNEVVVESDGMSFNFIGADSESIKEGPSALSAKLDWFAEFKWDSASFGGFVKAMGSLSQNYVKFEGKSGTNSLKVTVCDKDVRTSTFTHVIDLEDEIEKDFKVVLNKEVLQSVVGGSVKTMNVQLSNMLVHMFGSSEYHDVKYYLSVVEG